MKKAVLPALCLLALLFLWGCKAKEPSDMPDMTVMSVTFINSVEDADVWLLPQTEANLKTTVWGSATVPAVKAGESRQAPVCEPGDGGLYIFRMIDSKSFFYSANGIALEDGWTVHIKGGARQDFYLEVADENGAANKTYEVFAARL